MPEISLTDFVDYALAPGPSQLVKVRELKRRGEYEPAHDYWRDLREWIIDAEYGRRTLRQVEQLALAARVGKRANYQTALAGFRKFARRRPGTIATRPKKDRWEHDGLIVRVNPELCYRTPSGRLCVKLYFKKEPRPTKHRADIILLLVSQTIANHDVALLDVPTGKLIEGKLTKSDLPIYLRAQATAFVQMWQQLK